MSNTWPHTICENCHAEYTVEPVGDTETILEKYCPYCGELLDDDLDLSEPNFDLNDDFD